MFKLRGILNISYEVAVYIKRQLYEIIRKNKKSLLLLGPRQTGKSTLIRTELKPDLVINLANENTYLEFAQNPKELEQRLEGQNFEKVFIDEVQRLPSLLNTIQAIIDESGNSPQFLLSGSSARKLRRGNANLLPGRVHTFNLGALTAEELNFEMNAKQALQTGTLPGIYTDPEEASRSKTLRSYSGTYLKEEIQAESLTRNLEGFARFLMIVASAAGDFLDLSKLSSEAQVQRQSGLRFFEILEDTLIVHRCEAFAKSTRKRLVQHPRFFFFDNGVLNGLLKNFTVSGDRIGNLFENLLFTQLLQSSFNKDCDIRISSYRTEHGAEVDFIVEHENTLWAIEAKASANVGKSDLRGLHNFGEYYGKPFKKIVAYLGDHQKKIEDVSVLPWQMALKEVFKGM